MFLLTTFLWANGAPFLFNTGHRTHADLAAEFVTVPVCPKPALMSELIEQITKLMRENRSIHSE
jgi:hypothetical protein